MKRIAAISIACSTLVPAFAFADPGFNPLRRFDDGANIAAGVNGAASATSDIDASLQSNSKIEADQLAVANDFSQLRSDVRAGNSAAVSLDQAKITTDFATLQADETALRDKIAADPAVQAALAAVLADRMALAKDAVQLRSDEIARNKTAARTDEAQLDTDEATLRTDLKALRAAIEAVTL
ncbi:MAG TPA: hypothetical protein VLL50_04025 [Usitatibacter sp.]|nr:hypothetical protein [Usitatibacter sp.]